MTGALSAVYVPPDDFGGKVWFLPDRPGVRWFYHAPRAGRAGRASVAPAALDRTLDAPLVPVVRWARAHGLETGPSCAGHTVSPGAALAIWRGLEIDAAAVRGPGLRMVDVETGRSGVWSDRGYRSPYGTARELDRALRAHERAGLLPLRGSPVTLARVAQAARAVPWMTADTAGPWLRLRVHAPTEAAQRAAWAALAGVLTGAKALPARP